MKGRLKTPLEKISIEGFKSFRSLKDFVLNPGLNILIGANGAGKSNFVDFFRVMERIAVKGLGEYVGQYGQAETFFFRGTKRTPSIEIGVFLSDLEYAFSLLPTVNGSVMIKGEAVALIRPDGSRIEGEPIEADMAKPEESNLGAAIKIGTTVNLKIAEKHIRNTISKWRVYHFHDTSPFAPLRKAASIYNHKELFADGSNLPAFLWGLKKEHSRAYEKIASSMRFIMPLFEDFVLEPESNGTTPDRLLRLCWRERGSHYIYQPWQMSDGALRGLALMTVLMQPDPPSTIIIDEPELGLYPNALDFLAGLMHSAAQKTQLIVTTQSPDLLRTMEPEDVIVVHNRSGESTFERLERSPLTAWLEEYSMGELWLKNVIQAGPDHA
ncbi:MAG: AAA family ATPase [Candidatus Adiutrix sp.]|jgi:predicted ATPase|nr:AAA family ATPase [Candidatus Adiutrix sp.]